MKKSCQSWCVHTVSCQFHFLYFFLNSWILPTVLNMRCQKFCLNSPMYSDSVNNMMGSGSLCSLEQTFRLAIILSTFTKLQKEYLVHLQGNEFGMNYWWGEAVYRHFSLSQNHKNSFELLLSISVLQLFIDCFIDHNEDRSTWTKAENLRNHSFVKSFKPENYVDLDEYSYSRLFLSTLC